MLCVLAKCPYLLALVRAKAYKGLLHNECRVAADITLRAKILDARASGTTSISWKITHQWSNLGNKGQIEQLGLTFGLPSILLVV